MSEYGRTVRNHALLGFASGAIYIAARPLWSDSLGMPFSWVSFAVFCLFGALLGALLGWVKASRNARRSRRLEP